MFRRNKKLYQNREIDPDEIFLDSSNLPQFDTDQFEGRIEKPIPIKNIVLAGAIFVLVACVYLYRISDLQILNGEKYKNISENNRLNHTLIFAERGAILDRHGKVLAWNEIDPTQAEYSLRAYRKEPGTHSLIGYVKYPKKDKSGIYYNTTLTGEDGLEKYFDGLLSGENGVKIIETDVHGKTYPGSLIKQPYKGEDIVLTIDSNLQEASYKAIKEIADRAGYKGGIGLIMDVKTGEILASAIYPEYDSAVMTNGQDVNQIEAYFKNSANLFLDKIGSGQYTPGSIMKPFFAFAALEEGVITPDKKIESTGKLEVPNPYKPGEVTVFKDWKAHGWTNMKEAIAVSSDVYFYEIGGGFGNQKGLGIEKIEKYARMFGFGSSLEDNYFSGKEGSIPNPEWKKKNFNGDIWRIGDTYHTAIGQYGFQVTPVQVLRAVSAIANDGYLVNPILMKSAVDSQMEDQTTYADKLTVKNKNDMQVVRDGMRMTVTAGTMKSLNISKAKFAGKTGTAQLGVAKKRINSWSIGFFPYDKPKYAFVFMLENGPNTSPYGATAIVRLVLDWMLIYTPQYITGEDIMGENVNENSNIQNPDSDVDNSSSSPAIIEVVGSSTPGIRGDEIEN